MKYEELNEVRKLKKQIEQEQQKLSALKSCVGNITATIDGQPKGKRADSRIETLAVMITDTERRINELQSRLTGAVTGLTAKIILEVEDNSEQALMIYRYVSCKYFREIGFLMGYSEQHVYHLHNRILEKLRVDKSQ